MIVDRLTKSAHFLPVNVEDSLEKLAQLYVDEIVSTQNHFLKRKCLNYKFVKCFENIDL